MFVVSAVQGFVIKAKSREGEEKMPRLGDLVWIGEQKKLAKIVTASKQELTLHLLSQEGKVTFGEEVLLKNTAVNVQARPGLIGQKVDFLGQELVFSEKDFLQRKEKREEQKWDFIPTVQLQEIVFPGQKLGFVQENEFFKYWLLAPNNLENKLENNLQTNSGAWRVQKIRAGQFACREIVACLEREAEEDLGENERGKERKKQREKGLEETQKIDLSLAQALPLRENKNNQSWPFQAYFSGQPVLDSLFPIKRGGSFCLELENQEEEDFHPFNLEGENLDLVIILDFHARKGSPVSPEILAKSIFISAPLSLSPVALQTSLLSAVALANYYSAAGYRLVLQINGLQNWVRASLALLHHQYPGINEESLEAKLSLQIEQILGQIGQTRQSGLTEEGSVTVLAFAQKSPLNRVFLPHFQTMVKLQTGNKLINWEESFCRVIPEAQTYWLQRGLDQNDWGQIPSRSPLQQFAQDCQQARQILAQNQEIIKYPLSSNSLSLEQKLILHSAQILAQHLSWQKELVPLVKTMELLRIIIARHQYLAEILEKNPKQENLDKLLKTEKEKIILSLTGNFNENDQDFEAVPDLI